MKRLIISGIATAVFLAGCGPDSSGQRTPNRVPLAEAAEASSKTFGDYVLHFSAISTDQLQAEVARTYNITRSKNRAMLSISIVKGETSEMGTPVEAEVDVAAANLTGQIKNMTLRRVQEGDAIYYIGDVAVANGETLVFDITAMPVNETEEFSVRFSRQFFVD